VRKDVRKQSQQAARRLHKLIDGKRLGDHLPVYVELHSGRVYLYVSRTTRTGKYFTGIPRGGNHREVFTCVGVKAMGYMP